MKIPPLMKSFMGSPWQWQIEKNKDKSRDVLLCPISDRGKFWTFPDKRFSLALGHPVKLSPEKDFGLPKLSIAKVKTIQLKEAPTFTHFPIALLRKFVEMLGLTLVPGNAYFSWEIIWLAES